MTQLSWPTFERLTQKWLQEDLREIARLQELPYDEKCGARTRAGTSCNRWPVRRTGRCPNHGGMSTGPGPRQAGAHRTSAAPALETLACQASGGGGMKLKISARLLELHPTGRALRADDPRGPL